MLRLGGRGSHATLMSEGLGLDRESWGAALGAETEEHRRESHSTDVGGEAQGRPEACPGHTARREEAQDLREEREPLRGAPSWRGCDSLPGTCPQHRLLHPADCHWLLSDWMVPGCSREGPPDYRQSGNLGSSCSCTIDLGQVTHFLGLSFPNCKLGR